MGAATVFPTTDSANGNLLLAQKALLSQAGSLQSLSFYVVNAAGKLRLGIYDSTGPNSGPGNKLAEAAEITPITGWNTATVTSSVLPSGTYWLAYFPSDNALSFKVDRSGAGTQRMFSLPYGPMPATFSTTPSGSASQWSFYATMIPGNAPPPVIHSVLLNWVAPVTDGAASYNLYRSGVKVGNVAGSILTFTDKTVSSGTYTYAATTVDSSGNESIQSNTVALTIP
jgi:hypothetical protein